MNDLTKKVAPVEGELYPIGFNFRLELSLTQYIDDFLMGDNVSALTNLTQQLKNLPDAIKQRLILLTGSDKSFYKLITRACYDLVDRSNKLADNELDFIDMREFMVHHYPYELSTFASRKFLVVNNIDLVIGYNDWEGALFELINKVLYSQTVCLFSCYGQVADFDYSVPDLQSRLEMFQQYVFKDYSFEEYIKVLGSRAYEQGLELKQQVLEHIAEIAYNHDNFDIDRSFFKLMRICSEHNVYPLRISLSFINKHIDEFLVYEPEITEAAIKRDS